MPPLTFCQLQVKSIVNVSSIAGLRAYPGAISYKISKSAMDQLTRYGVSEPRLGHVKISEYCTFNTVLLFVDFKSTYLGQLISEAIFELKSRNLSMNLISPSIT